MTKRTRDTVSRRSFLQGVSLAGAGSLVSGGAADANASAAGSLPERSFGRTNQKVTTLGLGTWPAGRSSDLDVAGVARLVQEAVELGIGLIDTARNYGKAEEGIARGLGKRRKQVLLTSKVWADTAEQARESLETSLRTLKTDYLDLVYIHSIGNRNVKRVLADDGTLPYLLSQKAAGKLRFIGISGHSKVESFLPLIRTGQIDVAMLAMNFVDRHTYAFERKVLPAAREQGMGIACMKVFGGMAGGFSAADGPNPGPMVQARLYQQAIRYALGLTGVATLVIGPHTIEQLRQNVAWVQEAKPLSADERQELITLGETLAPKWGPHFGPAV